MSRKQKRLEAMRNNPRDWSIDDLIGIATDFNFEVRHGKGSHVVFTSPLGATQTIPAKRPVKAIYVKLLPLDPTPAPCGPGSLDMIDLLDPSLIPDEEEKD